MYGTSTRRVVVRGVGSVLRSESSRAGWLDRLGPALVGCCEVGSGSATGIEAGIETGIETGIEVGSGRRGDT